MSQQFISRLHSGLETVRKWESAELLIACRKQIPFHELCPEQFYLPNDNQDSDTTESPRPSPCAKPDDEDYQGDDLFLKRLAVHFQSMMTWVNNPPCEMCGNKETKLRSSRGPITPEERNGEASRVEVYFCPNCNAETTTFPRYNNPLKLLETKKGRCGEYANLFGAFCRSAGFETRYIVDFTDHVWVEVWSDETSRWIMADGCEGTIDEPSMYEKGWGKNLCYNLAFTTDSVVDVTRRYTRKFNSFDFQARRRQFCPGGETQSDMMIAQFNSTVRANQNVSQTRIAELDKRQRSENKMLDDTLRQEWGSEAYSEGRLSGSLVWRLARGETGKIQSTVEKNNKTSAELPCEMYHIDCFHPAPYCSEKCSIVLSAPPSEVKSNFPECISVMQTPCGTGISQTISIVVIDEKYSCILQSRVFGNWNGASNFLSKLPDQRIVAIYSDLRICSENIDSVKEKVAHLGNFDFCALASNKEGDKKYFFYVGQVNRNAEWAICENVAGGTILEVGIELQCDDKLSGLKLQRKINFVPQKVSMRLPEEFMPLQSQLQACEEDKRDAFLRFMENEIKKVEKSINYAGFVSKEGAPVYLLSYEAFPFKKFSKVVDNKGTWTTYHYVPEPMWREEEIVSAEPETNVDVPVDEDFFTTLLGAQLLKNNNNVLSQVSTVAALSNTRLIAFYFSAHWCPPCRQFTPILSELYDHLKTKHPTNGLEVVFVSSDRDESTFNNYFKSMPWLSVPWSGGGAGLRQSIAQRFGVQGFPTVIVVDSISGSVVVPKEQARSEVSQACLRGDLAIEHLLENEWFERIPAESKDMMEILKLSCIENMDIDCDESEGISNPYLERSDDVIKKQKVKMSTEEQAETIKKYFSQLVGEGMTPNEAVTKAINMVAKEVSCGVKCSNLKGSKGTEVQKSIEVTLSTRDLKNILLTTKKYVKNVQKQPFTPKFRSFKLSNRIFDNITSTKGGLDYVMGNLGFRVYNTTSDFMASIPLGIDVDALEKRINHILEEKNSEKV